jgi:Heterokaryon incompatibility protein (HET)
MADLQLPTRLIDVGPMDGSRQPKLALGKQYRGSGYSYIALSHCWGPTPVGAPWKTTTATIQSFLDGITMDRLPRTFREAISFTRRHGVRFIWIDSLCIIQDSYSDWTQEAAAMGRIYSGALFTLISASGHSDGGCVVARNPLEVTPADLVLSPLSEGSSMEVKIFPYLPTRKMLTSSAPTTMRAWCQQEREFSVRTVQFTTHQILWTCKTITSSESQVLEATEPGSKPSEVDTPRPSSYSLGDVINPWRNSNLLPKLPSHHPRKVYYRYWYYLVETFSRSQITVSTDRLPALSSLAQRQVTHMHVDDIYLAGLWRNDILCGLLWARSSDANVINAARRPSVYISPSWSWACLNAGVDFQMNPFVTAEVNQFTTVGPWSHFSSNSYVPKVLDAKVELKGLDLFGQVSSGYIKLRGYLQVGRCFNRGQGLNRLRRDLLDPISFREVGQAFFDTLQDLAYNATVICLLIFLWPRAELGGGLALSQLPGQPDIYTRVGYVEIFDPVWINTFTDSIFIIQ